MTILDISTSYRVAIIGAREASPEGLKFAYEVGKLFGQQGCLVYSGGGAGIMEEACRGVTEGGGISVGILKESDGALANPYVQIPVMTGMGDLRNGIIIRSVHGAIAVEGAYGTLSEIAYTLTDNKPVFGFKTWDIPGLQKITSPEEAVEKLLTAIKANTHG